MKLFVQKETVQNPTIFLGWCLEKNEIEEFKRRGAKNPCVLLSVVNDYGETDRYVVPLEEGATYIQLRRPGKNRILATVVWRDDGNISRIKNELLSQRVLYEVEVLDYLKENFLGKEDYSGNYMLTRDIARLSSQSEIKVIVPKNIFAKKPPKLEWWWVNLWFEKEPRDQCQYRRRRFIAYTIQPPIVFLWVVLITFFRFLAAFVLLFCGLRNVNLKPIIHPFEYSSSDIWYYVEKNDSIFLRTKTGKPRHWLFLFFSPPIILIFLLAVIYIRVFFPEIPFFNLISKWYHYIIVTFLVMIIFVAMVYSIKIIFKFLKMIFNFLKPSVSTTPLTIRKIESTYQEIKKKKEEKKEKELMELLCDFKEEEPRKKTVYLRFLEIKAKVCKPFAL